MTSVAKALAFVFLLLLPGCTGGVRQIEGPTMGTTYKVTWFGGPVGSDFEGEARGLLEKVNAQMSTYLRESDLSQFNRNESTQWVAVPEPLARVVKKAQEISLLSGGAFDATVLPLVNLWGFGPKGRVTEQPKDTAIQMVRQYVGYQKLAVRTAPPALKKEHGKLSVDLSGIAKGYGVDVLGEALEKHGVTQYFVEIGGEVRTRGGKGGNEPWTVGVERPTPAGRAVQTAFLLKNGSVATSGDYRNYFEQDGKRYSHTLDPRSGRPKAHRLASVTVVRETCMEADALATALLVLGEDEGMRLARDRGWAVLMLVRGGKKGVEERATPEFKRIMSKAPGFQESGKVE